MEERVDCKKEVITNVQDRDGRRCRVRTEKPDVWSFAANERKQAPCTMATPVRVVTDREDFRGTYRCYPQNRHKSLQRRNIRVRCRTWQFSERTVSNENDARGGTKNNTMVGFIAARVGKMKVRKFSTVVTKHLHVFMYLVLRTWILLVL